jgi:DNA mismatch repair ATPase MutS
VQNELGRFSPREAVLSAGAMKNDRLTGFLREQLGCRCESGREACFEEEEARRLASNQFPEDKIEELLLSGRRLSVRSAACCPTSMRPRRLTCPICAPFSVMGRGSSWSWT